METIIRLLFYLNNNDFHNSENFKQNLKIFILIKFFCSL